MSGARSLQASTFGEKCFKSVDDRRSVFFVGGKPIFPDVSLQSLDYATTGECPITVAGVLLSDTPTVWSGNQNPQGCFYFTARKYSLSEPDISSANLYVAGGPDSHGIAMFGDRSVLGTELTRVINWTPTSEIKDASAASLFEAVAAFRLTGCPTDRAIADRLVALYRDAVLEGEPMVADSIKQFAEFFVSKRATRIPKITLTPDGMLRIRWIRGIGDFVAVEFLGGAMARMVAEAPRSTGLTARYFTTDEVDKIATAVNQLLGES